MTEIRTVSAFQFALAKDLRVGQKLVEKNAVIEKMEIRGTWVLLRLRYLDTLFSEFVDIKVRTSKSFEVE